MEIIGIVITGHGAFPEGLLNAATMIMGEQEKVKAVGLQPAEGPEDLKQKLKEAVAEVDEGDGVLVLADLFGGTPANVSAYLLQSEREIEVLTGINLPLLLEILNLRLNLSLKEVVKSYQAIAGQGFKVLSEVLKIE